MPIRTGARIDRPVQLQMFPYAARGQIHALRHSPLDLRRIHRAGAMRINVNRQWLCHPDGITYLQGAARRQPGSDHVLCQIPRGIGGGPVYLGRIFARKRTAAVRGGPAVGIDDNLAPGQPRVTVRPTDDESPRRVHMPFGVFGNPAFGQHFQNIRLDNRANVLRFLLFVLVLGGQHNGCHFHRLAILIAQRQLRFRIRPQCGFSPRFAHFGQSAQNGVGIVNGGRHVLWRLQRGIAKHDALIAGPVAVHPLGNMRRLPVQIVMHLQSFPMKLFLLIANFAHTVAHNAVYPRHHRLCRLFGRQTHLAAHNHPVCGGKGFARHPRIGLFGQKCIQNCVGYPITNFIRMPLRDGLRGKYIGFAGICGGHGGRAPLGYTVTPGSRCDRSIPRS